MAKENSVSRTWRCRSMTFDLARRGEIMGILNVTPDSFSDGGRFSGIDAAVSQAGCMIEDGAAIIDIGGESTRPGAEDVSAEEELARTIPVIRELAIQFPKACLSIDTSKPMVAEAAIRAGAHIVNDVTGFRDSEMIRIVAETGAGAAAMHMLGNPRTMQKSPSYANVVDSVRQFFEKQLAIMTELGVDPNSIVFDPGIGFGKTLEHNLTLIKRIDELEVGGRPILIGVSRKSFIGKLIESDQIDERNWPTVGITAYTAAKGVPLHRVHEVKTNLDSLRMTEAIINI